jgi:hypothetical protein
MGEQVLIGSCGTRCKATALIEGSAKFGMALHRKLTQLYIEREVTGNATLLANHDARAGLTRSPRAN